MAACGSSSSGSDGSTTSKAASSSARNAVTITAPGMQFETSGPLRPGVATITFRNTDDEAHMLAMARMKPGVTAEQVAKAAEKSEDAVGPLLVEPPDKAVFGTPAPVGAGQSSTVTSEDLPAGEYVLLCFFTQPDGTPHFTLGMVGTLDVKGEKATQRPESDGTITIDDSGITLPSGFTGRGTFLVHNTGKGEHSISIARLDPGVTLAAYAQHVGQAMGAGTSVDGGGGVLVGGVDNLLAGQSAYLTLDLSPAHYGYISTTDAQGPALPAQHGEFDVG
jgi:plastocyanin